MMQRDIPFHQPEDAVVEFVGGPYDGHVADTRSDDQEIAALATFICLVTGNGEKLGKFVKGMSPAGIQKSLEEPGVSPGLNHEYRFINRCLRDGRIVLRMEYLRSPTIK